MRLSNAQAVARPVYYDRNATVRQISYAASTVAPHAFTVRASYTVPAGKKAYLEHAQMSTRRDAAAAPVGLVQLFIRYIPGGVGGVVFLTLEHADNTLSVQRQIATSNFGLLSAADVVDISTDDLSTAGSNVYNLIIKLTEFDA